MVRPDHMNHGNHNDIQAADLGDPESYFYLALLQSAGMHGGEQGGGRDQARTWAICGTHAASTNAQLLLA